MKKLTAIALLTACSSAYGGTVAGFGGATEVTQWANNGELVAQYKKQVEILQAAWDNVKGQSSFQWSEGGRILHKYAEVAKKGQALSYALQNAEEIFQSKNPGYTAGGTGGFRGQFQDCSRTNLDSIQGALLSANLQFQDLSSEDAAIARLRSLTESSDSTVKVVQSVSMFAAQQVEQLQKLRQLQMAQIQMHAAYMATETSRKDNERKITDQHFVKFTVGIAWTLCDGTLRSGVYLHLKTVSSHKKEGKWYDNSPVISPGQFFGKTSIDFAKTGKYC